MAADMSPLLVGEHLLTFGQGIAEDVRNDILDCLMYARMVVTDAYGRDDWKRWNWAHQETIRSVGAPQTGSITARDWKIKSRTQLRNLALETSGSASSPGLKKLLERSLSTLIDSPHAETYFKAWFTSGSSESLQVVPCELDADGGVTVLVCAVRMTTSFWNPGLYLSAFTAWQLFSGSMTVSVSGAAYRFTTDGYARFRVPIRERLVERGRLEIITL